MADSAGKYRNQSGGGKGGKIRTETGRDRSDDANGVSDAISADLKGDAGDISHSIQNGKVPRDA
jgi:hypothetical protein